MNYRDKRKQIEELLKEAGIDDHKTDAGYLMMYVLHMNMAELLLHSGDELTPAQEAELDALAGRRAAHEPLQYILGTQEFMGLEFECRPGCLIPRQDTELLAEKVLEAVRSCGGRPRVLDMCTGSGCIAVSVAALAGNAEVTAADLSAEALEIAKANAERNKVSVKLVRSDMFESIEGVFDIIACNPPYVKSGVIPGLEPEVIEHEPMMALDGGSDGLDFYRRLAADAPRHLRRGGSLMVEMDDDEGAGVSAIFTAQGFTEVKIFRDLTGADRAVSCIWPSGVI